MKINNLTMAFLCLFGAGLLGGNSIARYYQLRPAQELIRTARRSCRRFDTIITGEEEPNG